MYAVSGLNKLYLSCQDPILQFEDDNKIQTNYSSQLISSPLEIDINEDTSQLYPIPLKTRIVRSFDTLKDVWLEIDFKFASAHNYNNMFDIIHSIELLSNNQILDCIDGKLLESLMILQHRNIYDLYQSLSKSKSKSKLLIPLIFFNSLDGLDIHMVACQYMEVFIKVNLQPICLWPDNMNTTSIEIYHQDKLTLFSSVPNFVTDIIETYLCFTKFNGSLNLICNTIYQENEMRRRIAQLPHEKIVTTHEHIEMGFLMENGYVAKSEIFCIGNHAFRFPLKMIVIRIQPNDGQIYAFEDLKEINFYLGNDLIFQTSPTITMINQFSNSNNGGNSSIPNKPIYTIVFKPNELISLDKMNKLNNKLYFELISNTEVDGKVDIWFLQRRILRTTNGMLDLI